MERYIKTYPKIFSEDECTGLIEYFEASKKSWVKTRMVGHRKFWELNFIDHTGRSKMNLEIYDRFKLVLDRYKQDINLHPKQWPEKYNWEEIRMKKYEANIGNFLDHVDVGSYESARRFLVIFAYLNDVEDGGETEFVNLDLQVAPECGKVVVFPSTWEYPHRGNMPISNDKYFLGPLLS